LERYYHTGRYLEDRPLIPEIIREYHMRLYSMNLLDFGSILVECGRLFVQHPEVKETCTSAINHVLVDEIQDANAIQHHGFLDHFSPPATFFAVGDRKQSIYKFRGARPDLMTERHPNAQIVDLNECFRCSDYIVEAANSLIKHNDDPLSVEMTGCSGQVGMTAAAYGRTEMIADGLQRFIDDDVALREIAIMARTHRSLKRMEQVLDERQIPCHRVGSRFDICTTDEFRGLHAAFRLMVNPSDNLAFLRLKRTLAIPNKVYADIRGIAGGSSHLLAAPKSEISASQRELFEKLADGRFPNTVQEASKQLIAYLTLQLTPEWLAVDEFWSGQHGLLSIQSALRSFALRDQQDDLPSDDVVTLVTIHGAKGLEWPVCLVINMNEGDFPGTKVKTDEEMEEERRVCYVAMTRAERALVMHYRRPEDQAAPKGKKKPKPPSRFLAEAGVLV
ncbi:MAG: ATP-dependent helicase, partial [Thermoguttaceae bacterium]